MGIQRVPIGIIGRITMCDILENKKPIGASISFFKFPWVLRLYKYSSKYTRNLGGRLLHVE